MRKIIGNVTDLESNGIKNSNINKEHHKSNRKYNCNCIGSSKNSKQCTLPASMHRNDVQELCKAFNQNFPGIYYFISNRDQIGNK